MGRFREMDQRASIGERGARLLRICHIVCGERDILG